MLGACWLWAGSSLTPVFHLPLATVVDVVAALLAFSFLSTTFSPDVAFNLLAITLASSKEMDLTRRPLTMRAARPSRCQRTLAGAGRGATETPP